MLEDIIYDIGVIGGGINGTAVALAAAASGLKVWRGEEARIWLVQEPRFKLKRWDERTGHDQNTSEEELDGEADHL